MTVDTSALKGHHLDTLVRELVAEAGARSAFVVLEDGQVIAAAGDFATQIVLVPDRSTLALGPVTTRSASGELIGFAVLGDAFIGAVYSADRDAADVVAALARVSQRSPSIH